MDRAGRPHGLHVRERGHVQVATASRIFSASLVGMPVGLVMLATLDSRLLSLIIAVSVLVLVFLLWREVRLPRGVGVERGSGFVSGVLLTATGLNGPPIALTLQALNSAR